MNKCPECLKELPNELNVCNSCGAIVKTEKEIKVKKTKKKGLVISISLILVLTIIASTVFVVPSILPRQIEKEVNYAVYIKDKEIHYTDLEDEERKTQQLTSRLFDVEDLENDELSEIAYDIEEYTYISKDGKYIFFIDKIDDYDEGPSLYYREIGNSESQTFKIDSDIMYYNVNEASTIVTYTKGEERSLYQYKISEDTKEKIANETKDFVVSDDGTNIFFINQENSLYFKNIEVEKEKIASEIKSIEHISEDFNSIYYIKEDSLYKQILGEERIKISTNVATLVNQYDSGEIYYLKFKKVEAPLIDFITDDKSEDNYISEPVYPSAPSWWDYDTDEEYDIAYKKYIKAYEEYDVEYAAYLEKLKRDELRYELEEDTYSYIEYTLCYFDGTKETVISDYIYDSYDLEASDETPIIYYESYNEPNFDNIKLSNLTDSYDAYDLIREALYRSPEYYLAIKSTSTEVEAEDKISNFKMNSSGSMAYYIDNVSEEKEHGDLYSVLIKDGKVEKPMLYDNDVYTWKSDFLGDSQFIYFKDCNDGVGDLYINKEVIDYDVDIYGVEYIQSINKIFYYCDWSSDYCSGTLKYYCNGETLKVGDDIYMYATMPDGRILYLCDYSNKYYKGELREWNSGEYIKISDDVVAVFDVYNKECRGYY